MKSKKLKFATNKSVIGYYLTHLSAPLTPNLMMGEMRDCPLLVTCTHRCTAQTSSPLSSLLS